MMQDPKPRRNRQWAVPRSGGPSRSLERVFERAIRLTAKMDAERGIILAIAFAHVLEIPLPAFHTVLRRYRARINASRAAP